MPAFISAGKEGGLMKVNGFSNFNLAGVEKRTTAGDQSTANREKSGKQEGLQETARL